MAYRYQRKWSFCYKILAEGPPLKRVFFLVGADSVIHKTFRTRYKWKVVRYSSYEKGVKGRDLSSSPWGRSNYYPWILHAKCKAYIEAKVGINFIDYPISR